MQIVYLNVIKKNTKINDMNIYQVLKVTKEGKYLVKTSPVLKSAINWAKKTIVNADLAPAEFQCTSKGELKDNYFYVSVRLLNNRYAIDAEIGKTQVYHE